MVFGGPDTIGCVKRGRFNDEARMAKDERNPNDKEVALSSGPGTSWWRGRILVISVSVCVLVLGVTGLYFVNRDGEPVYQGKRLSEWLIECPPPDYDRGSGRMLRKVPTGEAAEAVRHIGTNALPFLLSWVQHEPSPLSKLTYKLPLRIQQSRVVGWLFSDREDLLSRKVEAGFSVLGPEADGVIPELSRILKNSQSAFAVNQAAHALKFLGKDGLSVLVSVVSDRSQPEFKLIYVCSAIRYMDYLGPDGASAIPALVKCLGHTNRMVGYCAAQALGNFAQNPGIAVPALTNAAQSSDFYLRRFATRAIGQFGEDALVAVPVLQQRLNDSDQRVRSEAKTALQRVAPKVLDQGGPTNAGEKRAE